MRRIVWVCLAGLTLVGCLKRVTVNNLELVEDNWEADKLTVQSRAAIDLGCPGNEISIEPLDSFGRTMYLASQVAAKGCGKVAIYTRVSGRAGLALNSMQ